MAKKQDSPALQLVRLVYRHGQEATGHSWVRLNGALFSAVRVAIEGGLKFDVGDFAVFHKELRAGYWIGSHPTGLYAAACEFGNDSACKSYESCYGFAPYELESQRVFVGRSFTWADEHVTCTSIAKDALIACSYKPSKGMCERKILHRHSITPEQMSAENKRRQIAATDKKMAQAQTESARFAVEHRLSKTILDMPVRELVSKLDEYDQGRALDVLARRFKKADRPTLGEFLAIGHRWRSDHRAVTHSTLLMART